jgi:GGDEF domain-containing protein
MTLIFAGMTASASLIGLVTHFLPQVPSAHRTAELWLAAGGALLTALLIGLRRRLAEQTPLWVMHLSVAVSVVFICLGSWAEGTSQASIATTAYFVWVGLFVGSFFSLRAIVFHLTWVAAGLSVLLVEKGDATRISAGLMIFGVVLAASGASYYLSRIFGRLAATDVLTGLPNRQALDAHLDRELARSARYLLPLCVAIIDVDNLKAINDSEGHLAGDRVLRTVARHWKSQLRRTDVLARFGGDEFVALMLECELEPALQAFYRPTAATARPARSAWLPGGRGTRARA